MGSPSTEIGRFGIEGPVHEVRIARPLAVGQYKITRGQYAAFVSATGRGDKHDCRILDVKDMKLKIDTGATWRRPGFDQTDEHPVVCVTRDDAKAYAAWLTSNSGKQYRLLSEAEAEYVVRAGSRTSRPWGDDASAACRYENVTDRSFEGNVNGWPWGSHECTDGYPYTSPFGVLERNGFGLYDVLGNALEWTEDCFHGSYAGAPSDGSAWTSGDCVTHVLRGGSWSEGGPRFIRSATRNGVSANSRTSDIGFRLARTLP
jgi:formylglycine-generating enzyme required for sulfatase activity